MDEEELQKQNTDCVYFLASPLTCKKGIECEYRHSEIARLNPRDCWYWLAGSCLNPACAFRHPPLEGLTEALSEPVDPHHGLTLPVNKTKAPCFFYFNGFCIKGDRCSFLHGPDDSTLAWKSSKAASAVNDTLPLEKKVSTGSNTASTLTGRHPNPSEISPNEPVETQSQSKQDFHQLDPYAEINDSPHVSATQRGEAAVVGSDPLLPTEGFIQSRFLAIDQSSDEQADGQVEREEWLESSPGFDVLVEDKSENLGYEDVVDYLPVLDEECRELNMQVMEGYDDEDPIEYDHAYQDSGNLYKQETYDASDCLDNGQACNYISKVSGNSRETIFYRLSSRKRNFLRMEPTFDGPRGIDLRDHLKKWRVIDDHFRAHSSRRHDSSRRIGRIRGSTRWHGSRSENGFLQSGVVFRPAQAQAHLSRSRQNFREKRHGKQQFISSKVSRKLALKKRRSTEESIMFTGPKSLDQIKEEKIKAQAHIGDIPDFRSPRPLNDILKDKRTMYSVVDRYSDSS